MIARVKEAVGARWWVRVAIVLLVTVVAVGATIILSMSESERDKLWLKLAYYTGYIGAAVAAGLVVGAAAGFIHYKWKTFYWVSGSVTAFVLLLAAWSNVYSPEMRASPWAQEQTRR